MKILRFRQPKLNPMSFYRSGAIALMFSIIAFSSCKKEITQSVDRSVDTPAYFKVGDSSSFVIENYNPPLLLEVDSVTEGVSTSDKITFDLDGDGFDLDLEIYMRKAVVEIDSPHLYFEENTVEIDGASEILVKVICDTIAYKPTRALDTALKFNTTNGKYPGLLDHQLDSAYTFSGWQSKSAHTVARPMTGDDLIYYKADSLNWSREISYLHLDEYRTSSETTMLYHQDSTLKLPIKKDIRYKSWPRGNIRYLIFRFRKHIDEEWQYGWLKIEMLSRNELRLHAMAIRK